MNSEGETEWNAPSAAEEDFVLEPRELFRH